MYPAEYAEEAIKGVLSSCQVDKSILKKPFKDKNEQSSTTARDVFQKRPQIKAVENKVSIIKQNVLKRSASNYQQSQSHTLANFDKKMKLTQDIQEQP